MEEKYINDAIDKDAYYKWKSRLLEEQNELTERVTVLQLPVGEVCDRYNLFFAQLLDINAIFQSKSILGKHEFISVVFDSKLYYEDGIYRTRSYYPFSSVKH